MNAIETVKVSSRGQIVIPEEIREQLHFKEGSKLVLIREGNKITLEKEDVFLKELTQRSKSTNEEKFHERLTAETFKELDNPKDRAAAKWYEEQFKKGTYDEYNKS